MPKTPGKPISVQKVCEHLGIHWYRPAKLTQGLQVAYLRSQLTISTFANHCLAKYFFHVM
ncbi:MAG: hypothetical protein OXU36_09065 [Candidatus Poribacteria bacterium]|nr:hypothetical protein [Candidatus Poribacteria bacterium]